MSKDCNTTRNEFRIEHNGTAQNVRLPEALGDDYVRIDERDFADWLVFARSYAKLIDFYNLQDQSVGDWTSFWSVNVTTAVANLVAARVDWFREETRLLFIELQKIENQDNEELLFQYFNQLFNVIGGLAWQLDVHFQLLPDELPIKTTFRNLIKTSLAPAFGNWIGWRVYANMHGLLSEETTEIQLTRVKAMRILGESLETATPIWDRYVFSADWITDSANPIPASWTAYVAAITTVAANPDDLSNRYASVFGRPDFRKTRINFALRHYFFTNAFDQFLKGFTKLVQESRNTLKFLLSKWNRHEPHFALYLAFLRLLVHERDALNTLTRKHLFFYFERVLRLYKKSPVAAQAFVTFELAKHAQPKLLKEGIWLKAGKDKTGKDIVFALTEDFVPNKAKVAELKGVLKAPGNPALYQFDADGLVYKFSDVNRYFAAPIVNSSDGKGAELSTVDKQWHPFGNKTILNKIWQINSPKLDIGFAIASHYFFLTEAQRTVVLTLNTASVDLLAGITFKVLLTSEKGWFEQVVSISHANKLVVSIPGDAPAIVPYDAKKHGDSYKTGLPLLKCLLPNDDSTTYQYEQIKRLTITSISISVSVTGKNKLALSGSTGPLDTSKPFHPFGAMPTNGAVFMIGDKEVFQKAADRVTLTVKWKERYNERKFFGRSEPNVTAGSDSAGDVLTYLSNTPLSIVLESLHRRPLADILGSLGSTPITEALVSSRYPESATWLPATTDAFVDEWRSIVESQPLPQVLVSLGVRLPNDRNGFLNPSSNPSGENPLPPTTSLDYLEKSQWRPSLETYNLITDGIEGTSGENSVSVEFAVTPDQQIEPDFSPNTPYTSGLSGGFIRFVLHGDWGHSDYPRALAQYAVKQDHLPDPLYDPQLLSVSLDYQASTTIPLQTTASYTHQTGAFFHLYPFGYEKIEPDSELGVRLLPELVPQYASPVNTIGKDGGEWYIGLRELTPPQTLSLLIQVAEGSADPQIEKPSEHLTWSYLKANRWQPFEKEALSDGTNGLLQSGLVRLSVPRDATTDNTILTAGLHWIRVSAQTSIDAICRLVGIHTQAACVKFHDQANDPQLNALPLLAGTITKLVESDSMIKKVEQPYATFRGRAAETEVHFLTRVSERLRHKNRAITLWDYERIILEAFPGIHKVKCLNHVRYEQVDGRAIYRELAPGHVTVITISNLRNRNAVNPLRPYTSLGDLKNIEAYLRKYVSCFVQLHVKNPIFEPIRAEFSVKLIAGSDKTFYENLLNSEIIRFLSPWAFEEGKEIGFGGKIYKSALIDFIEERPYVDYLENFKLIHLTNPPRPDQESIEPSTLCSILVSAEKHTITILDATDMVVTPEDCGCG